ncbi:chitinase 2-like [Cornus florida]|uniref:chitinase 2-like n=1 Tax=Cornus florida TaxID=4283 RepID=UPI002896640F|nr:chitinase 2-like [Cornus florida]
MMEYIGATGIPVSFDDVPIEKGIDFHFILSFAIDADSLGNPQNGKFSPYWQSTLTPESVAAIKARHPNLKALASLSGWSLGQKVLRWYKPANLQLWISNAFSSLKSIVTTYHLDGIDIDYENFPKHNESFAYCIGELITLLKNQRVIAVATIAPFYSTVIPYIQLFEGYGDVIDYVNHQFYTDKVKTPKGYLEAFRLRTQQFDKGKVLPSYEVNGRGIQGDAFFEALKLLKGNGFDVNGVMIFSADASSSNDYYYERKSQAFLLNSSTSSNFQEFYAKNDFLSIYLMFSSRKSASSTFQDTMVAKLQESQSVRDNDSPMTEDDIVDEVLSTTSTYVGGLGHGVIAPSSNSSLREQVLVANKRNVILKSEIEALKRDAMEKNTFLELEIEKANERLQMLKERLPNL